jgi:hypothetical protein
MTFLLVLGVGSLAFFAGFVLGRNEVHGVNEEIGYIADNMSKVQVNKSLLEQP